MDVEKFIQQFQSGESIKKFTQNVYNEIFEQELHIIPSLDNIISQQKLEFLFQECLNREVYLNILIKIINKYVDQQLDFKQKIDDKNEQKEQAIKDLKISLQEKEHIVNDYKVQAEQILQKYHSLQNQYDNLEDDHQKIQDDNSHLQKEIQQLKDIQQQYEMLKQVVIPESQDKQIEIQSQIEKIQSLKNTNRKLQEEIRKNEEKQMVQMNFQDIQNQNYQKLQFQFHQLTQKYNSSQENLKEMQNINQQITLKYDLIKTKLEEIQSESDGLSDTNSNYSTEFKTLPMHQEESNNRKSLYMDLNINDDSDLFNQYVTNNNQQYRIKSNSFKKQIQPIKQQMARQDQRNPYEDFFNLTSQCAKLNSEFRDEIIDIDLKPCYREVIEDGIPYHQWYNYINNRLKNIIEKQKLIMANPI